MTTLLRSSIGLLLTTHLVASRLQAQFYWFDDKGERAAVRAEFSRPFIGGVDLKALTGGFFFSASGKFGQSSRLEAEVPMAAGGLEGTGSTFTIGNPYLGLRLHQPGKRFSTQLGVRFPLMADLSLKSVAAVEAAAASDADRLESFFSKTVTARAGVELHPAPAGTLLAGIRVGTSVFIPTDGGSVEAFLDYGGRIGIDNNTLMAALALTGRWLVTSDNGSLADRTMHQITGSVDLRRGPVRPGVLFRIPLDESDLDWVFGIRMTLVP
jgi:hypothetical protein